MKSKEELISDLLSKNKNETNFYHDLMTKRVSEVLLIANLYDALSIEREGQLNDAVLGDYFLMNLTSAPRIKSVNTYKEAAEELKNKKFDLVILMAGIDKAVTVRVSKKIKDLYPNLPVYLLLNNNTDLNYFRETKQRKIVFDNIFVWNGDSSIFVAMIKLLEDKLNVENDTKTELSKVILLVEDSEIYYSRYLPILYKSVMEQTQRIVEDASAVGDLYKVLKFRLRPKILLATEYEDAIKEYNDYKEHFLCLITDVKYKKEGRVNSEAGFHLVEYVKSQTPELSVAMQSSNIKNKERAENISVKFISKNSESLALDIKDYIRYNLGFGDFIYRDDNLKIVAKAANLNEFYEKLFSIPESSLIFHATKNHFSLWLRARGEIELSKELHGKKTSDFTSADEIRQHLIKKFQENRIYQNRGKIVDINDQSSIHESNIAKLTHGALGGKGRGLAFINNLIYKVDINTLVENIKIKSPKTFIIGTDEYDSFIENNNLHEVIFSDAGFESIKQAFLSANLSEKLEKGLKKIIKEIKKPLAVRSSGLFEDSLMQPFAGVFSTYLLPNNHEEDSIKLEQLKSAIKLVFASVFSETSQNYITAVNYKIEEEKMAVIIQEVVGKQYENIYYPHISGTAQSYNYYPFGKINPEDGTAVMAIGLGIYVVEGEKAYRFSPKHPTLQNNSYKDMFKNSQTEFFAVDLSISEVDFKKGETAGLVRNDIFLAEKINKSQFRHCVSVYDPNNDTINPGLEKYGPRIVNFANILKYNYAPIAEAIDTLLYTMKYAMGTPVEIEYAVDLEKDEDGEVSFYILQVKPLIGSKQDYKINLKKINFKNTIVFSENAMGNGSIVGITDVIFVPPEKFDKSKTEIIASEIAELNKKMISEKRKYILIGPGRWGTRDKWIGIPVNWTQISNAKVIVETSLPDFPLEASAGSHFFHNVTSMDVGYVSIQHSSDKCKISWDKIEKQEVIYETEFVNHIRFEKELNIQIDGKKRIIVISNK